jgi:hypothetical protein
MARSAPRPRYLLQFAVVDEDAGQTRWYNHPMMFNSLDYANAHGSRREEVDGYRVLDLVEGCKVVLPFLDTTELF